MKRMTIVFSAAVLLYACGGGSSQPPETIQVPEVPVAAKPSVPPEHERAAANMEASDCASCHKTDAPMQGPSYVSIAAKYAGKPGMADKLAERIIAGGSGIWGEVKMTPHPAISKEDAVGMVNYILSLKK